MATNRRPRSDIKADSGLVQELDDLKGELGTSSRTSTIRQLLEEYRRLLLEHEEDLEGSRLQADLIKKLVELKREFEKSSREGLPVASSRLMKGDRPALITGTTGAGKTRTIKTLLDGWAGPVFALDVKGVDFPDFETLDLGKVSSYPWASTEGAKKLRFTPTTELSAQGESEAVLQLLALVMRSEGHPLRKWVIVLEEGQRFTKNLPFKEILSEGRVFCRKLLIGSQLSRPFKELLPIYAPMSFEA